MRTETSNRDVQAVLQDAVLDSTDVTEFLDELCRQAATALEDGGEVLCGITLLRERKAATVASSSEHARRMDEVQYNFDQGPCLTAAREQQIVHVPDVGREERWPEYIAAITGHGTHSIVAVPFDLAGDARAALNLYSATPGAFDVETTTRATDYANQAARSLRLAVRIAEHSEMATNLKAAMESRTVIDVATGMIMCQNRCTHDEAVTFLKKASSHRNVKLRELATRIVANAGTSHPPTHFEH
ncbi:GAF and ANTAR domain-containing protein [Arthrobacter tecti]